MSCDILALGITFICVAMVAAFVIVATKNSNDYPDDFEGGYRI